MNISRYEIFNQQRLNIYPDAYNILLDTFSDTLSAGSVNGTFSDNGVLRTVVDDNLKLSVGSGSLSFATGGVASGNPGVWYNPAHKTPGRMVVSKATITTNIIDIGYDRDITSNAYHSILLSTTLRVRILGTALTVGTASSATEYSLITILRYHGSFYFIKGGAFTNFSLLYFYDTVTTPTIYYPCAVSSGTTSVGTVNYIKVPNTLYLPPCNFSDGFSSGTPDGLGHIEGKYNNLTHTRSSEVWVDTIGTWGVSSGKRSCTALSGGLGVNTVTVDHADIFVSVLIYWVSGTAGLIVRWIDANNHIRVVHTGTNVQLVKVVASTQTTVFDTATTYVDGAELKISCVGTAFRVYYNNLLVNTGTISDAALQTSAIVGLRTSSTSNSFDDFEVYLRGSSNEYSALDSFVI